MFGPLTRPCRVLLTSTVIRQEAAPEHDEKEGRRRLEDEPLLAARIVVEECLNVLLDVDDIDRLWVNSPGARIDKAELQKRRSNLLEARHSPAAMSCWSIRKAPHMYCTYTSHGRRK